MTKQKIIDVAYGLLISLKHIYELLIDIYNMLKYFSAVNFMTLIDKITFIFMNLLVLLILFYVGTFIAIAIGNLSTVLGIYNLTANQNPSVIYHEIPLHQALQYFPRYQVEFLNMAGIVALLLLGLLLLVIFKAEKGIVILPFEVDPRNEKISGKAIAEMLTSDLKRIRRILKGNRDSKSIQFMGKMNLAKIYPKPEIRPYVNLLDISPEGKNITKNIEALGTFGFGPTSLPLGNIIILLKEICPGTDPGLIVTGSLHKYGSEICLMAHMKGKNCSWSTCQENKESQDISHKDISHLVCDLSIQIAFEQLQAKVNAFEQLQAKVNKRLASRGFHIGEIAYEAVSRGQLPKDWKLFKYFIKAIENLQRYSNTKECIELDRAKINALRAATDDRDYSDTLYLLFNVGIAYLNLNKNNEAERLARYIVTLRPYSALAWFSWGLTLKFLNLNQEAIECYDKALSLKDSVDYFKIEDKIYSMKGVSLRSLKHYDEAIEYFEKSLDKRDDGYTWGHYGITLEAKADKEQREAEKDAFWLLSVPAPNCIQLADFKDEEIYRLRNEAERAYQRSVELCSDFVPVHAALARIFQKKDTKKAKKECDLADRYWQAREDQTEYNRACYEINCGQENKAQRLLEIAIQKKQVSHQWLEDDPDWKYVRDKEPWFQDLLKNARDIDKPEDITDKISRAAIRRKLDEEGGKKPFFFYKYDIEKWEDLAAQLIMADDPVSKHLRERTQNINEFWKENELICELNKYLDDADLYEGKRFEGIELTETIKTEAKKHLQGTDLHRLNRELLKAAYPEIGAHRTKPELCEIIRKSIQDEPAYVRARFYAVDGKAHSALNLLRYALVNKKISSEEAAFEPDFEFIRDDIDFQALLDEFSGKKGSSLFPVGNFRISN